MFPFTPHTTLRPDVLFGWFLFLEKNATNIYTFAEQSAVLAVVKSRRKRRMAELTRLARSKRRSFRKSRCHSRHSSF